MFPHTNFNPFRQQVFFNDLSVLKCDGKYKYAEIDEPLPLS